MAQKRRSFSPFGPQGQTPTGPEAPEPKPSVDEAASDFAGVIGGKPAAAHDSDDDAVFGTETPVAAEAPEPIGPPRSGGRWWEEPDAGTESKPAPESPEPAPVPSEKPEAARDDGWGAPDGQIVQPLPTPETGPVEAMQGRKPLAAVGGNGGNWWDMPDDAEEPTSGTKPAFDATNRAVEADETPQEAPEPAFDATNHAAEADVDSTPQPDADGLHETPQPDSWFAAADTAGNAPRGNLWGAASETDDEEGWGGDEDEDGGWDDDEEEKPEPEPRSGRGLFGRRKAEPDDADTDESEEDWDDEGADDDWDDPDDAEEGPAEPAKRSGFLGFLGGRKAKPQSGEEADPDDTGDGDEVEDWDDPDDGDEGWGDPDGTGDSDGWMDDEGPDGYDSLVERFDSAGEGVRVPWKPIVIGVVSVALVAGIGFGVHAKMRADAEAERDAACKALAASWSDWKSAAKEADDLKIEHSKDVERPCPVDVNVARAEAKNLDDKTASLRSEIAKAKALAEAKESARKALGANPKATQETKDALNKALEGDDANEILKLSTKLPEEQKAAEEAERKAAEEKAKADAEAAKKAQEEEARRQAEAQAQAQQQQYTPRRQYVVPKRPAYTPQQQTQPQQQQPQGGGSSSGSMGGSIG